MMAVDRALIRLARLAGVATQYRDVWGKVRRASPDTLRHVLSAMGLAVGTPREVAASSEALELAKWRTLLPPVIVVSVEEPLVVPVTTSDDKTMLMAWVLALENGDVWQGSIHSDALALLGERRERKCRWQRLALPLNRQLPLGYHRLSLTAGDLRADAIVIVAPQHCYLPSELNGGRNVWGVTAQLYSLRSTRNWGIGDFTDLAQFGAGMARFGARTVGINPLHALFAAEPRHVSPYSPSSRLFLNPLYIDVEAVPEFASDMAQDPSDLRATSMVDYVAVARLKATAFDQLYRAFTEKHLGATMSERGAAFRRFQAEGGATLRSFATFTALQEHIVSAGGNFDWRAWPAVFRDSAAPEVQQFAMENRTRIERHEYLQWEADRQLSLAAQHASKSGLSIGLYRDLAVGVASSGAETWIDPDTTVADASIGAPPDLLNLKGQDWGLAPANPMVLQRQAYAPFIAALRANMRYAGALRIDHVMALMHLYWIPRGATPQEGAYVQYPFDALRRIVALESTRHRCAVIGEDLGTVPRGFREAMAADRIFSYRLLLFERNRTGHFLPPEAYRSQATASFSTHDLATLKGFWLGRDLEWRRELGLYPSDEAAAKDQRDRRRDRRYLLEALVKAQVLSAAAAKRLLPQPGKPVYMSVLAEAVHRFLGRTSGRLMLMKTEDATEEIEQTNMPGTIDEHPNWRRKLSRTIDEIFGDPLVQKIISALNEERAV